MAQKKRKVSHKGSRVKGSNAERELVSILDKFHIPSQRVLGSGAFSSAKSDIKVGINLEDDGKKPPSDESKATLRAEVKNRADNPEYLFDQESLKKIATFHLLDKSCPESIYSYLNQDDVSKIAVLRRGKVKPGDLKAENYNQVYVVVMGLEDWIELFKKAHPEVVAVVKTD